MHVIYEKLDECLFFRIL